MDWTAAIEQHRVALRGILAGLVAMVAGWHPGASATLPRHVHRAVLRLLRPAESAARRLAIALAGGLAARPDPRPSRKRGAAALSILVRDGVGTGIVRRPGAPVPAPLAYLVRPKTAAAGRRPCLPLFDALPRWRRRRWQPPAGAPRICMFDAATRPKIPAWRPPLPDDPLDAGRLFRRLDALGRALDDLPGLARRFLRWQARRDLALAAGRVHRVTALRPGRPPGGRLSRYDPDAGGRRNIRDVDQILAQAHGLAHVALNPDTS